MTSGAPVRRRHRRSMRVAGVCLFIVALVDLGYLFCSSSRPSLRPRRLAMRDPVGLFAPASVAAGNVR